MVEWVGDDEGWFAKVGSALLMVNKCTSCGRYHWAIAVGRQKPSITYGETSHITLYDAQMSVLEAYNRMTN